MVGGHLQSRTERFPVISCAQSSLEAMQDEDDSNFSIGMLGSIQLLGNFMYLQRIIFIWVY